MTEQQFAFYSLNAMARQMDVMARNGVNIAWLYESCRDVYAAVCRFVTSELKHGSTIIIEA